MHTFINRHTCFYYYCSLFCAQIVTSYILSALHLLDVNSALSTGTIVYLHGISNTKFDNWRIKNQLDATCYFIELLIGSACFGHYYAHHQELATMILITTFVVSFLVCCMLEFRCELLMMGIVMSESC